MDISPDDVKQAARVLRRSLAEDGLEIGHGRALEIVARQLGFADWNVASAALAAAATSSPVGLGPPVPVLRVQDWSMAEAFYRDYLGLAVDWVHRFEPHLPAYVRMRRDQVVLDLSEHHGDGTPGSVVWLPVRNVTLLHRELRSRREGRQRPGIDKDAPGGPTLTVTDPFGNTIRFCQADVD